MHRYAREHLNIESERQRQKYDQRLNQHTYDWGNAVWFYNPKKKNKISPCLQRPWEGPYVVLKRISDVVYRIQKTPQSKPRVIHHDRLRPYKGEAVPTWLPSQRGNSSEASVGETSVDSKMTSGSPSAKGGQLFSIRAPVRMTSHTRQRTRSAATQRLQGGQPA